MPAQYGGRQQILNNQESNFKKKRKQETMPAQYGRRQQIQPPKGGDFSGS